MKEINYPEKIKDLIKGLKQTNKIVEELKLRKKIIEKEIRIFGNASHVILPKECANKTAKIIIQN